MVIMFMSASYFSLQKGPFSASQLTCKQSFWQQEINTVESAEKTEIMSQDSWELWSSPHSTCHWCRRRQSPFWGANLPWDNHETSRNEIPKDESCFQGFAVRVQSFNCLSVESGEGRSMVLAIQKRKVSFYKTYPCCCEIRDNDHWINPCQCLPKKITCQ